MNMYATLTFTTVVAWAALVLISLIFLVLIIDALRPKSEAEKAMQQLQAYRNGYAVRTDWRKIAALFVVWFVSGWYLFA